jgi:RNA polymerase sigma-70 factor (ECF subfamily)
MLNEDEEICRLLRLHDERGMERLFATYYRPLVVWADTFLDDMTAAEDLVQEFFVKLWEREIAGTLLAPTLKAYLFTSVRNISFNTLERRDPLRHARPVTGLFRAWAEYDDLTERLLQEVESEIEKLPPRSKEVVKAVYLEGLRYKEVARRHAISVATVKTLLVGALKRLREEANKIQDKLILLFYHKIPGG